MVLKPLRVLSGPSSQKNSVHKNNHNLVDKLSKLVDIEEDPYEPIDLVEEVMGNDKNAVCVVMSLTGENSYNCTLCVARDSSPGTTQTDK